ncbi:MAG: YbaK/EbsC family protein [Chloroflexi bacterium]|nr:YbaK/EbsC family protein [Chloroflexota bacterium]
MPDTPPVSQKLTELGIPHRVFRHTGQVTSLEQAAAERGQVPAQVIRSIVFRLAEGRFAIALMAGAAQISWPALRAHFGQSRLTMADADEVIAATGYRVGTVAPIGLPRPLPVLIDASVLVHEEISMGSGMSNTGIIMKRDDLLKLLPEAQTGNFAAST